MSSLSSLLISFAVIGAIFTYLTVRAKKTKSLLLTFLQHFTGVWFIFSGLVKAVDPIGTAYKMEDYFNAFEQTFSGLNNVFAKIAPVFPWLLHYTNGFAILMILLEIVLGVMLIIGYSRKLTVWLFFTVIFFFTVLTGFTYLTGFVPSEANFFDFAKWGPYVKTQMRVTDCGCFGDFLKLDPKISFFKDLGLMIPTLIFLFAWRKMHQFWTPQTRNLIVGLTSVATLIFCLNYTYWNLPTVDFRPFKVGSNIRERKELESKAKTDILGWVLRNDSLDQVVTFMEPKPNGYTYAKEYPKAKGWKVKDQIQTDLYVLNADGSRSPITKTKIADFAIEDGENGEVTEDILQEKGYSLLIIAYHLEGAKQTEMVVMQDTTWANDTIRVSKDSIRLQRRIASVEPRKEEREVFIPTAEYSNLFQNKVNPLAEAAKKAGWKVYAITTIGDAQVAADFKQKTGADYPFYKADDKLLKTMIRANPGIIVLKDGVVISMYHHRSIPTFEKISK